MNKHLLATFSILALLGAGCSKPTDSYPVKPEPVAATPSAETVPASIETKTFTLDDVAKHASETDCWLAVDGKVYDVTKAVEKHPGGPAILKGCGKDATEMFKGVEKHGEKAREFLTGLYIGDLK